MAMAKDTNAMTWHSQLLFELCRKTGRTAPSIKRDFYEKNSKYPYTVTVGNICGPCCETSTEAEIVAATAWLDKYEPSWRFLRIFPKECEQESKRIQPASLNSNRASENVGVRVNAALRRGEDSSETLGIINFFTI